MNIFIIGWQASAEDFQKSKSELLATCNLYPSLDPQTLKAYKVKDDVFFGCISHSREVASPRRYFDRTGNQVVFYDGCLVDMQDSFMAHDAGELGRNWNRLGDSLEGQFVAVRIGLDSARIDLMTDPLGIYQVYYLKRGRTLFVSNSINLLCRLTGENALDPDGVSLFLATSGYGKDFTLFRKIKVIPGGQIWTWEEGKSAPKKRQYCRPQDFICKEKRKFSRAELLELSATLARPCKILARHFGPLEAPITAGKDSRLMTALLMHENIPAEYFSAGAPSQNDVRIGGLIASSFGLPHRVKQHDINKLSGQWHRLCRKFVAQTDASVSLAHIANIIDQPASVNRLGVHLYGIGGEAARKSLDDREFYMHRPSLAFLQKFLFDYMAGKKRRRVLKSVVYEHVKQYANEVVKKFWDYGFPPLDVFKARSIFERSPRWSGPNFKQVMMTTDVFSPFCVRGFIRAALQIHALRRYADYLHYRIIKTLNPELWSIELAVPWKTQSPVATVAGFLFQPLRQKLAIRSRIRWLLGDRKQGVKGNLDPGTRRFQRSSWLEANLEQVRSFCLDNWSSEVWDFVDRKEFEKLTVLNQDVEVLRKRHKELYDTFTVFVAGKSFKEVVGAGVHQVSSGHNAANLCVASGFVL